MSALVDPSEIHRLSIEEYHDLIASGGFSEDIRVELIEGWVVDMSPRSPEHENAVRWLMRWFHRSLDFDAYDLLATGSMTMSNSEPEPDFAVIDLAPFTRSHPSRARLIIEISLSSHRRDLHTKPRIYAPFVEEYWVIDLQRLAVVTHRDPQDATYARIEVVPRGEAITAEALTLAPLDSDALFAAAFAEPNAR